MLPIPENVLARFNEVIIQTLQQCTQAAHAVSLFFQSQQPKYFPQPAPVEEKTFPPPRLANPSLKARYTQDIVAKSIGSSAMPTAAVAEPSPPFGSPAGKRFNEWRSLQKSTSPAWDQVIEKLSAEINVRHYSRKTLIVKKLIIWRNNIVAHKGSKNVLKSNEILAKHPISVEDSQTLLDEGFKILNNNSYLYKASSWSRQIIGHDDFKAVFTFMNLSLEKWDQDREEEFKRLKEK